MGSAIFHGIRRSGAIVACPSGTKRLRRMADTFNRPRVEGLRLAPSALGPRRSALDPRPLDVGLPMNCGLTYLS